MFSPEAASSRPLDRAARLRGSGNSNPRRRQRTSSADSTNVRQTNPKRRKRSALATDTFNAPSQHDDDTAAVRQTTRSHRHATREGSSSTTVHKTSSSYTNGFAVGSDSQHYRSSAATNGSAAAEASFDSSGSIAVRSKGPGGRKEKRSRNEDGVELTKTDNYILARDRGIPPAVQEILGSEAWHAKLCPELGFAVVLTQKQAIVWKYAHTRLAVHDSSVQVIDLPFASGSGYNTLPVGTLVHDAGAGDLALLVLASGGKVVYYESVRAAASSGRDSDSQQGEILTGSISGVFSSEHVSQIAEAESDGFILSTTLGRLFHLSVRDPQGRPKVTTQQLRMPSHEKVGFFGSIRNALSGGSAQDIASIIPLPGKTRSSRQVIVATAKGDGQLWGISRHGSKQVDGEWDLRSMIEEGCRKVAPSLEQLTPTLLDLSLMPSGLYEPREGEHKAVALAAFFDSTHPKYLLIDLTLRENSGSVDRVRQITVYAGPEHTEGFSGRSTKPTLLIPEPGHTAFVVFDTKILIVSLLQPESNPEAQLQDYGLNAPESYQECLFFNRSLPFHSAGCAVQADVDRADKAVCDLMVHGFGHIKLAALSAAADEGKTERKANLIRSRLEQVIFYGSIGDTFLNFRDEQLWQDVTATDMELATRSIISSILDSSSPHVPTLMPSMEQQLKLRSNAITELNKFVQRWSISTADCWRLLWAAEKLASALAIYNLYNQALSLRSAPDQKVLLDELVDMIHENDRTQNEPDKGEHDAVRHYLVYDVARLSSLIAWAPQSIDQLKKEGVDSVTELAPLMSQAADILITALNTAWTFRENHAETYGLGREVIDNGIYQRSYSELPEKPWTATEAICDRTVSLVVATKEMAVTLDTGDASGVPFEDQMITKLAEQASDLTDCTFRAWEELCRWVEASTEEDVHAQAKRFRTIYKTTRLELLGHLIDMSSHTLAADLAEKYNDMDALAFVIAKVQEQGDTWSQGMDPDDREQGEMILDEVRNRVDKYFDLYGKSWAHAYFTRLIDDDCAAEMMDLLPHRQSFLSEFMKSKSEQDKRFFKLAWINEVRGEQDFKQASKDLWMAERSEQRLWAKQVGLALAKICKFAAIEQDQIPKDEGLRDIRGCTQRLKFTEVQDKLYQYVCPLLLNAIDDEAELELAMSNFGQYVKGYVALEQSLRKVMHQLVRRRVVGITDLIEALSLISPSEQLVDEENFGEERFYWALWMLHASHLEANYPERATLYQRLIWRRVILQDDWEALNRTEGKTEDDVLEDIRSTTLYKTLRVGYQTGLFEKHPPFAPGDLEPAGETLEMLIEAGLNSEKDEAYLTRLAQDLSSESILLEEIISKARLEMWWKGVVEGARADLRGENDTYSKLREVQEEERAAVRELSKRLQEEQAAADSSVHTMNLDGAAENGVEGDGQHVLQNGHSHSNGYHENGTDNQTEMETEKAASKKAVVKKTKKTTTASTTEKKLAEKKAAVAVTKKRATRAKKDVEGDVVMAS